VSEKCRATFIDKTEGAVAESEGHMVSGTSSSIKSTELLCIILSAYKILFRGIKILDRALEKIFLIYCV